MKIKVSSYLVLCAFAALFFLTGCGNTAPMIVTVNFGNPPKGGGACSGRGLCNAVAQTPNNSASGITATLLVSPTDKNDLIMSFSMNDLKQKQPDQVQNFIDGGTYTFDGSYDLSVPLYAPLKLAPRPRIDQNCKTKVEIKGDIVSVFFTYAHS